MTGRDEQAARESSRSPSAAAPGSTDRSVRVLRVAAVVALVALLLIVWSIVDGRPIAVILAMSVGQALGTLTLVAYAIVVVSDLRRAGVLGRRRPEERR